MHLEPEKAHYIEETAKRLAAEGDDGAPPITQLARTFPALADGPTYPNFSAATKPGPAANTCVHSPASTKSATAKTQQFRNEPNLTSDDYGGLS